MTSATTTNAIFDRLVVHDDGAVRELTAEAFFRLPLRERVRLLLGATIEFYRGSERIEEREALALLSAGSAGRARATK